MKKIVSRFIEYPAAGQCRAVILIDSGVGNKFSDKFREIYDIDYSQTSLMKSLAEKNIQPEDVTDVILTHLHFDHVGGATHLDPDGQIRLAVSQRQLLCPEKKQLEWAQKGFPKDRASYLSENIEPLYKSGKLKILEGPQKLMEGIELILSEGHTVAQQMVRISGQNENLIYLADLIPMTAISILLVMAYDLHPVQTIQEKEEILETAIKKNGYYFLSMIQRSIAVRSTKARRGIN